MSTIEAKRAEWPWLGTKRFWIFTVAIVWSASIELVDALERHPADLRNLAIDYDARVSAENEDRWQVSAEQDRGRVRAWLDARIYRAASQFSTLLDPAATLLDDASLLETARKAVAAVPAVAPPAMPSRAELLAALSLTR